MSVEDSENNGLMFSETAVKNETKYAMMDTGEPKDQPVNEAEAGDTNPDDGVNWKKRHDDLRTYQNQQLQEFRQREQELLQQLEAGRPQYTPPKTKEELDAFRKDNPEIVEVAESLAHFQVNSELDSVRKEIKELSKIKADAEKKAAYAELKSYHSDYEEIKVDPTFKKWAKNQPQQIQDWLFKGSDARLAARAIDLFKAEHKQVADKGKAPVKGDAADAIQTKSAVVPETKQDKIWTAKEIHALSDREYEGLREEIDKAFREGRIKH